MSEANEVNKTQAQRIMKAVMRCPILSIIPKQPREMQEAWDALEVDIERILTESPEIEKT